MMQIHSRQMKSVDEYNECRRTPRGPHHRTEYRTFGSHMPLQRTLDSRTNVASILL